MAKFLGNPLFECCRQKSRLREFKRFVSLQFHLYGELDRTQIPSGRFDLRVPVIKCEAAFKESGTQRESTFASVPDLEQEQTWKPPNRIKRNPGHPLMNPGRKRRGLICPCRRLISFGSRNAVFRNLPGKRCRDIHLSRFAKITLKIASDKSHRPENIVENFNDTRMAENGDPEVWLDFKK
jgi:hypothetical protein